MAISTHRHADPRGHVVARWTARRRRFAPPRGWSGRRVAIAGTIAMVILGGGSALATHSSWFDARSIDVSGAAHLSRHEVLSAAGLDRHTNVPWLDESEVQARLEREPWVAAATVSTSLPWSVHVSITERVPVATTDRAGVTSLVAGDGTVLGDVGSVRGLPRIELPPVAASDGAGASATGAARALGAMSDDLRARVSRVIVGSDGTLELRLVDGTLVSYGRSEDQNRKGVTLERMLTWASTQPQSVARISLVAPEMPAVVFAT